jgi:hypothetical protein
MRDQRADAGAGACKAIAHINSVRSKVHETRSQTAGDRIAELFR